jgi:hypothetical protein
MTSLVNTAVRRLPRLELPIWLPEPVAEEAETLYDSILQQDREYEQQPVEARHARRFTSSEQIELLCRLASDQRMKSVWRELYRKRLRPSNEFLNPAMRAGIMLEAKFPTLHDPKNQDLAAREFLNNAFWLAAWRSELPMQHEINSRLKPFTMMAARLREDAQSLLSLGASELADNLDVMAIVCEKYANPPKPGALNPIVKRSRGDQALRAYILRLSVICRELFGKGLPGTVATTAGVVFSKKLSGHQVRDMVRANNLEV